MEQKDSSSCIEQVATMEHRRRSIYTIAATLATPVLVLVLWSLSTIPATNATSIITPPPSAQPTAASNSSQPIIKKRGLCVIGCTPYVDPSQMSHGIQKYWKLVQEMADTCQVIAHVGDTKPGRMPCNEDIVTASVRYMVDQGNRTGSMVLYAPGDNELNDCHQHASAVPSKQQPSDILRAADARDFIIQDLRLNSGKDLTGMYDVVNHDMSNLMNMATCDSNGNNCRPYSCDFDKYVEVDNYAIATLEVIGSHWYLDDERTEYPYQNSVDPLEDRLALYLNAKDCALDWIDYTARTAFQNNKRAVFFLLHATFYTDSANDPLSNNGLGDFYGGRNLYSNTSALGIPPVTVPYKPFFDKLHETSLLYPSLMFQVIHADSHRFSTVRLHSDLDNRKNSLLSHHNVMIHQTEGFSRALTMYSRFTVDEDSADSFQPITLKQEWSRAAYEETPYGHVLVGYEELTT